MIPRMCPGAWPAWTAHASAPGRPYELPPEWLVCGVMVKRVLLFLATNLLVVLTLSVLLNVLGIRPYLSANGIDYSQLLAFCLVWGMGGAFISLALSRIIAKRAMGVQVIEPGTRDPAAMRAPQHRRPAAAGGRHPDARGRRLRFTRPERLRHRADQVARARRRLDGPAPTHGPRRDRGRPRPRDHPHRQRRHGDDDAPPGRRERVRDVPRARDRLGRGELDAARRRRRRRPSAWRSSSRSCSRSCS